MSEVSTAVSDAHFRYIADHTRRDDDFLIALKDEARSSGIPPIWISPEQASFMQILLKVKGARQVVEVGTLAGYSAIVMARALPEDGEVQTIELSAKHADFAERWIAKSDVSGKVRVHRGSGVQLLPTFETTSADAAFLDADKSNYPRYLVECLRILRPKGLVLVDNAFAYGQLLQERPTDPDVESIRRFNDMVAQTKGLHGIIAPIGDGCWVAVKE